MGKIRTSWKFRHQLLPSRTASVHGQVDNHIDLFVRQERCQVMHVTSFAVDVVKGPLNSFDLRKKTRISLKRHECEFSFIEMAQSYFSIPMEHCSQR
jgi:hypothetical protein